MIPMSRRAFRAGNNVRIWAVEGPGPDRALCLAVVCCLVVIPLMGACATAPVRTDAKADSRLWPTGARWRQATVDALRSPVTWGPAAGAAAVAAGSWDKKISHWAVENTPVFGSVDNAKQRSDDLRALSNFGMLGTAVAVPGRGHPWLSRIKRLLVEEAGVIAASSVTNLMKRSIARERPDQSDDHGFPSGHSTRAFAYAAMSSRNLDAMEMPDGARMPLKGLFTTLAAGTAWARVEGERHYPSDVLAGAAVGNFMALFVHDAFLGKDEGASLGVQLDPQSREVQLRILLP
jgi:membrane-associated phospholipid phosphatase